MNLDKNYTSYLWDGEIIKVKDFTPEFVQGLIDMVASEEESWDADKDRINMARMILEEWYPEELI